MISDDDLYRLAIFLGSCAMMMIVLYHFLDVNSSDEEPESTKSATQIKAKSATTPVPTDSTGVLASGKGK
ncbi:Oligosaccaryltransferase [Penicillium bovifimosum]|uniref:Dolichyl-diphosphooligosaccharide--protein glycosyltransferase subunit 4 n=1 Tax=Penicillium bovifimosum TaxID=126998 RepID=A0A9W9KVH5_9EURO|nr:Oligosaccaryltransferase [Penicillium bovifimosum]KAJ5120920.1 Oligosaccaryltransferase [Penicillium bovifimosum]